MTTQLDAIVIGGGQAGPSLAARLAKAGQRVALAERHLLGGTCVNTGCTPTKTLIASARVAQQTREAARFGVHITGQVGVSLAEVKARADAITSKSRTSIRAMLADAGVQLLEGHARLTGPHDVVVNGETFTAKQIFLNVGGRAAVPRLPGLETIDYLTNSSVLQLTELPRHLVIVGGGYIGIEFAQMFRRFGCEVSLVEMAPKLVHHEDPEASDAVAQLLTAEGIHLRLNAKCISFSRLPDSYCVHVDCTEGEPEVHGSHVLLAMGRTPNTADLGLDSAGVATDKDGFLSVDDQLRTSVPHIFALGDCNRRGAFTHTAYNDFEIVAANLLDHEPRRVSDRIPVYALFTDPPLAHVGMNEREARAAGHKLLLATRPMTSVSRAVEKGESFGYMKAIVDADTQRILGATIFGVGGDEAIHCIVDVMYANAPYTLLTHAVHIHPTVAELIPTLLESLQPAN